MDIDELKRKLLRCYENMDMSLKKMIMLIL